MRAIRTFSAAFDRVSQIGLKFKFISVGGSVLSICREFLSDRSQRVVVYGATSGWIPIVLGVPQESVLGPLLLSYIPVKSLSWFRTDYMSMQTTPYFWQLFASQQTDLLLLPPLTGSLVRFRSGAVAGA